MSHYSSIGFDINDEYEFERIAREALDRGEFVEASKGVYVRYTDKSGAELWLQVNKKNELIGMSPHYVGKSRFNIVLTNSIARQSGEMDAAFYCWANPTDPSKPESGLYPFVFDVPDFHALDIQEYPSPFHVQLSAFAEAISCYDDEVEFRKQQDELEMKQAIQSFIPMDLSVGQFRDKDMLDSNSPKAFGLMSGRVLNWGFKRNTMTGNKFVWIEVDTLGGKIDVVCDPSNLDHLPKKGGIIDGQFWLSGRLEIPFFEFLPRSGMVVDFFSPN